MKVVTAMLDSKSKRRQDERFAREPENRRHGKENTKQMELDSTVAGRTLKGGGCTEVCATPRVFVGQEN